MLYTCILMYDVHVNVQVMEWDTALSIDSTLKNYTICHMTDANPQSLPYTHVHCTCTVPATTDLPFEFNNSHF